MDLEVVEGVRSLPQAEWDALVGGESPFLAWAWLSALEESEAASPRVGWGPQPLVARENGRLVAACPLYLKGHSEGEFVFDWGWADAAERAGINYYPKLLVGVPFTPVTGARFLVAPGEDRVNWIRQLGAGLLALSRQNDLSSIHINFCRDDEFEALAGDEYQPRIAFQYHWQNRGYRDFDDYLASLRSKRRNQVRRELRAVAEAGIEIECLVGDEIADELFPVMYRIYRATIEKNPWGRHYLNERFFELLRERFRERVCFIVARRAGEIVAGTVNIVKGDALYGRYWGCFEEVRNLHFAVCYYAAIEACIERGLARFEPGAGGHYKQLRGFDPVRTRSLHWVADARLASGVRRFLEAEREESEHVLAWYEEHTAHRRDRPLTLDSAE
jgi:predicted N-acyltransferase